MSRYLGALALLLVALSLSWAKGKDEPIDQLIARADAAHPDQQPNLYMEIADRELHALIDSFHAQRWDEFRSNLHETVKYCDRAQSSAIQSKKKVKPTEIKIRLISQRLREMKLDVEVDDQASVQAAIDRLEHFRAELLRSMFELKGKSDD